MAESLFISGNTKKERYKSLLPQIKALVEGETDQIANISNIVAALKYGMEFFWVGVYFVRPAQASPSSVLRIPSPSEKDNQELVLGPFQGPVACTRIGFGKGVCGTAWKEKKTIIVKDVDQFPGHLSCSSLSKSEIVVPAFDKNGNIILILDVDSTSLEDFDEVDGLYLQKIILLMC